MQPESWQERLGKIAAIEPVVYLGPLAGGKLTREIMAAVRKSDKRDVFGGEEFVPLLEAQDTAPYSVWMMRFGEEGQRASQQAWHRHLIPEKGTKFPEYVSHRLLLLICSGGEAGVERCAVGENGEATGKIIQYSFKPDTLYALRFDGDNIHRFTSSGNNVLLAALSFHPLDRDYGPQGMNSQTVEYTGPVPQEREKVEIPGIEVSTRSLTVFDQFIRDSVLNSAHAKNAGSDAVSQYLEYLAMLEKEQRAFEVAADLVGMHKALSAEHHDFGKL